MKVVKTIMAGERGSVRFLEIWGEKLLVVRYREDPASGNVLTTIEIVVDEKPKFGKNRRQTAYLAARNQRKVAVRIEFEEESLRSRIKAAGGKWDTQHRFWILDFKSVIALGLKDRIVKAGKKFLNVDTL